MLFSLACAPSVIDTLLPVLFEWCQIVDLKHNAVPIPSFPVHWYLMLVTACVVEYQLVDQIFVSVMHTKPCFFFHFLLWYSWDILSLFLPWCQCSVRVGFVLWYYKVLSFHWIKNKETCGYYSCELLQSSQIMKSFPHIQLRSEVHIYS